MSSVAKKLISGSFIVTIGAFVGGVFSYLFNINIARMLGPSEYGDITTIMSLLTIASVGGGAILIVTMKYSGELFAIGKLSAIASLWKKLSSGVFILGFVIFLICLIFSKFIADIFNISSVNALIFGFSSFLISFVYIVNKGIIQGMQQFINLSVISAGEMILRFALGMFFVGLGWKIYGAIGSIVLAGIILYLYSFFPIRKIFKNFKKEQIKINRSELIRYSIPTIVANTLLVIGLNIDIILIKIFFSPNEAGLYAAISTVAKIILYVTTPIASVMFPIISEQKAKQLKHYKVLLFSIIATVSVGLGCLLLYYFAPWTVINILYGEQYLTYYNLLPITGLAILFYSLINLIVNYFLAISNFKFIWFFIIAIIGLLAAVWQWHFSIEIVAKQLVLFHGLVFLSMICYYLLLKKDQIVNFLQGDYE